jgi:hypothetical protein
VSLTLNPASFVRVEVSKASERLQLGGRAKYMRLMRQAETAHDRHDGARTRYQAARSRADQADDLAAQWGGDIARGERRLVPEDGHLEVRFGRARKLVADAAPNRQLEEYRAAAAAAAAEVSERAEALRVAQEEGTPAIQTASALNAYLNALPADALLRDTPTAVPKARVDLRDQLQAARRAVEQLVAERDATRDAPPAEADVVAMIKAHVAPLAERGRPLIATDAVHWPTARADVFAEKSLGVLVPDALAAMAWLQPELLIERLHAEARAMVKASGRQPGMPAAQRASAITALEASILEAERLEEAVLVAMEAAGVAAARRPTADPRAVLGITGPAPASN